MLHHIKDHDLLSVTNLVFKHGILLLLEMFDNIMSNLDKGKDMFNIL